MVDLTATRNTEEHAANVPEAQNLLNSSETPSEPQRDEISSPPVAVRLDYSVYSPSWMKEWVTSNSPAAPIATRKCKIHGRYRHSKGYEFTYVPTDTVIAPLSRASGIERVSTQLTSSNSLAKTCLAMFQTGYAAYSVYRARGDQITVYGYAAFGLTVIPYITMSILNLVAQIVSDDYPMLYMIQSAEMDEAIERGGTFLGAVTKLGGLDNGGRATLINTNNGPWHVRQARRNGVILENQDSASPQHLRQIQIVKRGGQTMGKAYVPNCSKFRRRRQKEESVIYSSQWWKPDHELYRRTLQDKWFLGTFVWPLGLSFISFALLGGLSQFHKGTKSTSVERGFTLSWLVSGMLFGFLFPKLIKWWQSTGETVAEPIEPPLLAPPTTQRQAPRVEEVALEWPRPEWATFVPLERPGSEYSTGMVKVWHGERGISNQRRISRQQTIWRKIRDWTLYIWWTILYWTLPILGKLAAIIVGLGLFVFCVPALGGFVVVGKMIHQYGSCSRV